jgi:hypothetical protein
MTTKKSLCLVLSILLLAELPLLAGLPGDKSKYIGGTAPIPEEAVGVLSTDNPETLAFNS